MHAQAVTTDGNSTTEFNDQQVASLAAGATVEVDFNANVGTAGDYKITVKVDEFNDVAESDEHDNSSSINATAVAGPADLAGMLTAWLDVTVPEVQSANGP